MRSFLFHNLFTNTNNRQPKPLFWTLSICLLPLICYSSVSTSEEPSRERHFRVTSVNLNLMPKQLNHLTTGNTVTRAKHLARFLLMTRHAPDDIFCLQELYEPEARDAFFTQFDKAGFECFEGPRSGEYPKTPYIQSEKDGPLLSKMYIYHSGLATCINKERINPNLVDAQNYQFITYDSNAFANHGVHSKGPLEKMTPKGWVRIRLQIPSKVSSSHKEDTLKHHYLDIYNIHLQSDPGHIFYRFNPSKVRQSQINVLKNEASDLNSEDAALQHLFIGDYNIGANWRELQQVKKSLGNVISAHQAAGDKIDKQFVTIGNPNNTSHSLAGWLIGGALYDHYQQQLDHALVSKTLSLDFAQPTHQPIYVSKFGVFPVMRKKATLEHSKIPINQSLTDHEAIFVDFTLNALFDE